MIKTTIAALVAATALTTVANAATYRIDVMPADGVKFAPFGAGEVLVDGAEVSAAVKLQAIDGKPVDAYAGHNNTWFIVEAEAGDELVFTAMQGNSVDTIGQAVINLPTDMDVIEMQKTGERMITETMMNGQNVRHSEDIVEAVVVDTVDATRDFVTDINGFDAGADEGRDTLVAVGQLGEVRVRELSK